MASPEAIHDFFAPIDVSLQKVTLTFPAPVIDGVDGIASALGLPVDQIKVLVCLALSYLLAVVFSMMPPSKVKHAFSLVCGLLCAQFVLGTGWIHSFITSVITYGLVKFGPARYAPYVVFIFNLGYLSLGHIYRIYVDYMGWTMDFTGPQMILTIKLSSFAFNYFDGVVDRKRIEAGSADKGVARVYATRKKYALDKLPSLLEFFGYVYCFPSFLCGPAFEYREYEDTISLEKFKLNGKVRKPSSFLAAMQKLLAGLGCVALFLKFAGQYSIPNVHSVEILSEPFLYRVWYVWFTLFIVRMKYYFAWKVAEGATTLAGFGFEGFDDEGKPKGWNAVSNMDIAGFELAQSIREASRAWNKGTQAWLERYVYSRSGNSLLITYFCSAFWHGFYPGYYIFFMSVPLATAVNRLCFKRFRPYFLNKDGTPGQWKIVYDAASLIATSLCLNYLVIPFQMLAWEYTSISLLSYYYAGHIALVVVYLLGMAVPIRRLDGGKRKTA